MNKCQDSREIAQLFLQVIPLMGRVTLEAAACSDMGPPSTGRSRQS